MKKLLMLLSCISCICYAENFSQEPNNNNQSEQQIPSPKIIGGWYPVFFHNEEVETIFDGEINNIIGLIRDGKIKSIKASYINNINLAMKIAAGIQKQANIEILITKVEMSSDSSYTSNIDDVVLTINN